MFCGGNLGIFECYIRLSDLYRNFGRDMSDYFRHINKLVAICPRNLKKLLNLN